MIVETISQEVALTKHGPNWIGECPWCKMAAFSVSPMHRIFYCFNCERGGNEQDFVNKTPKQRPSAA